VRDPGRKPRRAMRDLWVLGDVRGLIARLMGAEDDG
jgi:hypothetical protein